MHKPSFWHLLFGTGGKSAGASAWLLVQRIIFGLLLLSHGIAKLTAFGEMSANFPDPFGWGSSLSLSLAIFAEVFCAIGFMVGFLYRLVLLPMITTMSVAFFSTHSSSIDNGGELALAYLFVFISLWVSGAGRFSADAYIVSLLTKKQQNK